MSEFIPTYGTAGIYQLKAPFDTLMVPQVSYACTALRKLSEITGGGGNPQEQFYTPYGLTDEDFARDASTNATIVTLEAAGYDAVQVPSTFILGHPEVGGVPYTALMLTIKLGALPNSQDLSVVKQKISDDVLELLGVDAVTQLVALSLPTLLTVDQAKIVESARQSKIDVVITDYTKYVQAQRQLESAQEKIAELETFIRSLPPAR